MEIGAAVTPCLLPVKLWGFKGRHFNIIIAKLDSSIPRFRGGVTLIIVIILSSGVLEELLCPFPDYNIPINYSITFKLITDRNFIMYLVFKPVSSINLELVTGRLIFPNVP